RTRAALQAARLQVDDRIRTLDARLTDMQAEANRKKLASAANPPLDPRRLVKASKELDQLIGTPPATAAASAPATPPPAASSLAEAAGGGLVRVCPGGKFFHRPGCKRVQKQTMSLPRADAERRGWKRCPTCLP